MFALTLFHVVDVLIVFCCTFVVIYSYGWLLFHCCALIYLFVFSILGVRLWFASFASLRIDNNNIIIIIIIIKKKNIIIIIIIIIIRKEALCLCCEK